MAARRADVIVELAVDELGTEQATVSWPDLSEAVTTWPAVIPRLLRKAAASAGRPIAVVTIDSGGSVYRDIVEPVDTAGENPVTASAPVAATPATRGAAASAPDPSRVRALRTLGVAVAGFMCLVMVTVGLSTSGISSDAEMSDRSSRARRDDEAPLDGPAHGSTVRRRRGATGCRDRRSRGDEPTRQLRG